MGGSEAGFLAHAVVCEELSREWSSVRSLFNMNGMTCPMSILRWGTDQQSRRFVPGLIAGELIGLFALTEPDVGSDVAGITTRAERRGDVYVLNGSKTSITTRRSLTWASSWLAPARASRATGAFRHSSSSVTLRASARSRFPRWATTARPPRYKTAGRRQLDSDD